MVTNLLKLDPLNNILYDKVRDPENVKQVLQGIYVNKDRVDDESVDSIIKPSLDEGANKVFQSTLTGDPGVGPEELLRKIPESVKIAAGWGEQDGITPPNSWIAKTISEGSSSDPDKFQWKMIQGGHVLHDDSPEQVLEHMNQTFEAWFKKE